MALTNTQLCYYDSNILRLPADKRTEYHAQVDRLISELSKSIRGKTEIKITRVVKAGSFASDAKNLVINTLRANADDRV